MTLTLPVEREREKKDKRHDARESYLPPRAPTRASSFVSEKRGEAELLIKCHK